MRADEPRDRNADRSAADGDERERAGCAPTRRTSRWRAATMAKRNATRPDASLIRLSPFRMCVTRGGKPHATHHRIRRHRVGRRDDRAQRERGGERDRRNEPVHHPADAEHRYQHEAERQQHHRSKHARASSRFGISPAVGEQQRRDEQQEEHLRVDVDPLEARHERQRDAARDQQRAAAGSATRLRERGSQRQHRQQHEDRRDAWRHVEARAGLGQERDLLGRRCRGRGSRCDADSGRSGG